MNTDGLAGVSVSEYVAAGGSTEELVAADSNGDGVVSTSELGCGGSREEMLLIILSVLANILFRLPPLPTSYAERQTSSNILCREASLLQQPFIPLELVGQTACKSDILEQTAEIAKEMPFAALELGSPGFIAQRSANSSQLGQAHWFRI